MRFARVGELYVVLLEIMQLFASAAPETEICVGMPEEKEVALMQASRHLHFGLPTGLNQSMNEPEMHSYLQNLLLQYNWVQQPNQFSNQIPSQVEMMNWIAEDPRVRTICEVGFNSGHASLIWLLRSNASVYSFNIGTRQYSRPAATWLGEAFPNRLLVSWGDSVQVMDNFFAVNPLVKCNLVFIDGSFDYPVALRNLQKFQQWVDPQFHVLMMDDVFCQESYCAGPTQAWKEMQSMAKVDIESAELVHRKWGYVVGHYI